MGYRPQRRRHRWSLLRGSYAVASRIAEVLPVDLLILGCQPSRMSISLVLLEQMGTEIWVTEDWCNVSTFSSGSRLGLRATYRRSVDNIFASLVRPA